MKKFCLLSLAILSLAACNNNVSPKYANRAEAIAAQIHDPHSKYVVVTCHRGDWRNFPENSIPAIESIIRICVNVDQGYEFYDEVLAVTEELGVTDQILIKGKKPIEVVAAHEAKYPHNMMYMPIVDIQRPKGIELFNSYLEQGVVPLAYEVCWQTNDGAFEDACTKILDQGSKIWVNTIWASLCGGDGNDDDAAYVAKDPGDVYQQYLDKGVSMIQTDRLELLIGWLKSKGRHTL